MGEFRNSKTLVVLLMHKRIMYSRAMRESYDHFIYHLDHVAVLKSHRTYNNQPQSWLSSPSFFKIQLQLGI